MSDHSDSGSSGLADWALVNSQGEVESSEVESNTSSIEVVGQDVETEEEEQVGSASVSRETSPECIELEQLMRKADADADTPVKERKPAELTENAANVAKQIVPRSGDASKSVCSSTDENSEEVAGACCAELLQTVERTQSPGEKEGEEKLGVKRQLSQESDSPASSDSILSLSGISSLSNTSKSSRSDSDSESDFVRLEKESSSISSHESEQEEPLPGSEVNVMATSGSSVGSGFNFLSGAKALPRQPSQEPAIPEPEQHAEEGEEEEGVALPPSPPPVNVVEPEELQLPPPVHNEEPVPPQHQQPVEGFMPQRAEADVVNQPPLQQLPQPQADDVYDADDGDTESSAEDQDDRIESEQSDDSNSAQADDQGDLSLVNDLGDLPVERGAAERHYIHHNNQQLNGRLNRAMLAVVVLAVGLGLGHWIGSAREHFSQMEIQLSQMKRLHQMQDEYVQCLAVKDELHLDYANNLRHEREQHQEAITDLRHNNMELQEELQAAQDQLERILTAQAKEASTPHKPNQRGHFSYPRPSDLKEFLVTAKLLIASEEDFEAQISTWGEESRQLITQARQSFMRKMEEKLKRSSSLESNAQSQHEEVEGSQNLLLREARQQINNLKNENAELKLSVAKMRYNADNLAAESVSPPWSFEPGEDEGFDEEQEETKNMVLPPPPNPIPPPPGAGRLIHIPVLQVEYPEPSTKGLGDKHWHGEDDYPDDGVDVEVEEEESDFGQEEMLHQLDDHPIAEPSLPKASSSEGSPPQPVPMDVNLLQRNLTQERQRADMWRRLYLAARTENRKDQPINSSACLHFLSQKMNVSSLMHSLMRWNLTGLGGTEEFADLTTLVSSIIQLQRNLVYSLPSLWQELSSTIHSFQGDNNDGSKNGENEEEEFKTENDKDGSDQSRWSEGVKKLLNKTRGTLSNVSQQLQKTWGQVKDASRQLWPGDDSVLGRMASRVKEGVTKLSHKVKRKASRWFNKPSKKDKHKRKAGKEFKDTAADKPLKKRADRKEEKKLGKKKFRDNKKWKKEGKVIQGSDEDREKGQLRGDGKSDKKQPKHAGRKADKRQKKMAKHEKRPWKKHHKDKHETFGQKHKHTHRSDERAHGKHGKKDERHNEDHTKEPKHFTNHQKDVQGGKKHRMFDQLKKEAIKLRQKHQKEHLRNSAQPESEEILVKLRTERPHQDEGYKESTKEEIPKDQPKVEYESKETEFHTKAKDHSFNADRAAAKAMFELEKRFQTVFSKIGSMSKESYNHLDKGDISEIQTKISKAFSLDLPKSAQRWLECQSFWWGKARPQRMLYIPMKECVQYLAPWQLGFLQETREKLESGECVRKRRFSCIDPPAKDEEDYYQYLCVGDEGYERPATNSASKESAQKSEEGQYSEDQVMNEPVASNEDTKNSTQQTEEDDAWYLNWAQGRDQLRTTERKAEWMFERARDRDDIRKKEHKSDWMFERASDRDASRQNQELEWAEDETDDDWEDTWHEDQERSRYFRRERKKQQKRARSGDFEQHGRDFRQKYGRTTFCEFC